MSDPLSNYLMEGSRHASISAETLELMGKQAANRLLNDGLALNESISKLAAEHKDINAEQVKRICEFANQSVYLAKHDQSKTAGASSSYPQFDLADPSRIIQEMSDGARPTVTTNIDLEYSKLPPKAKTASAGRVLAADKLREDVIEIVFGKTSSAVDVSQDTIVNQVMTAKTNLKGAQDSLGETEAILSMNLKEAQAKYYENVRQHLLDSGDFADVVFAAQSTGMEGVKIASALRPTIERLLVEKVASASILRSMTDELEKRAHRIVNPEHPLVQEFSAICVLTEEKSKVASALAVVDEQLERLNEFIKESFGAGKTI